MNKCLDLFCKQGGSARGIDNLGFDVTGVDKDPQPRYPYRFIQADALTMPLKGYDFYWASPPCQKWSKASAIHGYSYPDLIEPIRNRLLATGKPVVIENVQGAPLENPIMLCGTMFGLRVKRHRYFECHPSISPMLLSCSCEGPDGFTAAHRGISSIKRGARLICVAGHNFLVAEAGEAMGIDWMTQDGLREAIPPVMAQFIVEAVMKEIEMIRERE